jgi:hypothetical protein
MKLFGDVKPALYAAMKGFAMSSQAWYDTISYQ